MAPSHGRGLDEELIVGESDLGAGEGRHDAVRDGLPHTERIADGEHDVADLNLIGVSELQRREALVGVLETQNREIGTGVFENDVGLEFTLVG